MMFNEHVLKICSRKIQHLNAACGNATSDCLRCVDVGRNFQFLTWTGILITPSGSVCSYLLAFRTR
jgi:hypothetical protein